MKQKVKAKGDSTHNPDTMHLNMNMGLMGITMDVEAYMNMLGQWVKMDPARLGMESIDQLNQAEMDKLNQFTGQFKMTEEENEYILTFEAL